ncbi:hypothetical protein D917_04742 [Trichinella nativa]|uniref:Uncharacterized protein n=1 Tax=Trichinella nativa TaxID=6335 RepID=A0A1Y3E8U1_9BILA|nr:hypothetical protein D917_04742 [Trichinella nativa]
MFPVVLKTKWDPKVPLESGSEVDLQKFFDFAELQADMLAVEDGRFWNYYVQTQSPCLVEPLLEGLSKWKKILLWKNFDFDVCTDLS